MLRSAVGYVMQAGLAVGAVNRDDRLVLVVHGARLDRETNGFVPVMAQDAPARMLGDPAEARPGVAVMARGGPARMLSDPAGARTGVPVMVQDGPARMPGDPAGESAAALTDVPVMARAQV